MYKRGKFWHKDRRHSFVIHSL